MKYVADDGCVLHPRCVECTEPICMFDYPDGPVAYLKQKALKELLDAGCDIDQAADKLVLSKSATQRRYKRSHGV